LPVHWAPSVYICTPGWIAAVSAGAQVGAAETDEPVATRPAPASASAPAAAARGRMKRMGCLPRGSGPADRRHHPEQRRMTRSGYAGLALMDQAGTVPE